MLPISRLMQSGLEGEMKQLLGSWIQLFWYDCRIIATQVKAASTERLDEFD